MSTFSHCHHHRDNHNHQLTKMTHTLDDVDDRLASLEVSLPSFAAFGRDWALNNRNLWTELNADRGGEGEVGGKRRGGAVCSSWTAFIGLLQYSVHIPARLHCILTTRLSTLSPPRHPDTSLPLTSSVNPLRFLYFSKFNIPVVQ